MLLLNILVSLIGLAGWVFIWVRSKYQTGSDCRTQVGVMAVGAVWALILVSDCMQTSNATGMALTIRVLLLVGLWSLQPKLERRSK